MTRYSYRGHLMAGRPFLREVYDDKPNHRVNLPIEYPEDL